MSYFVLNWTGEPQDKVKHLSETTRLISKEVNVKVLAQRDQAPEESIVNSSVSCLSTPVNKGLFTGRVKYTS